MNQSFEITVNIRIATDGQGTEVSSEDSGLRDRIQETLEDCLNESEILDFQSDEDVDVSVQLDEVAVGEIEEVEV